MKMRLCLLTSSPHLHSASSDLSYFPPTLPLSRPEKQEMWAHAPLPGGLRALAAHGQGGAASWENPTSSGSQESLQCD